MFLKVTLTLNKYWWARFYQTTCFLDTALDLVTHLLKLVASLYFYWCSIYELYFSRCDIYEQVRNYNRDRWDVACDMWHL